MTKLNVTYPAVNVLVNGVEYRKVDRKAQAGDIVKAKVDAADVEAGAFYAIRTDADGDVFFIDGGGDRRYYYLMDGRAEVYEPVTQRAATSAAEITFEGPDGVATYRKVDRDARVGDVIKMIDGGFDVTDGELYRVESVDTFGDPQITDDDGDEYDTDGDEFEVYEKVSGAVADSPSQQYREVKRVAVAGERIRIVNPVMATDYGLGDEFTVTNVDTAGDAKFIDKAGERNCAYLREYVVLDPIEAPETYVHDGVTYRKESRVANVGELVLVVANTMVGNKHGYKIGEVTKIIGEWPAGSYGPQRKGSGKSGPFLATADYVVLVPTEPKRLTAGDYAKVIALSDHSYVLGTVVKIVKDDRDGRPYKAEKPDGSLGNWLGEREVEPATETEFLAQRKPKLIPVGEYGKITQVGTTRGGFYPHGFRKGETVKVIGHSRHFDDRVHAKSEETGDTWCVHHEDITAVSAGEVAAADPRDAFAKGDKVRLISGGGEFPLYGFDNGKIYEVDTPKYDAHPSHNGVIKIVRDGGNQGFAKPEQLEKLTAEESSAIEKERAETEKWAEIGRKVGEFKRGDVVSFVKNSGKLRDIGTVEDIADGSAIGVRCGAHTYGGYDYEGVFFGKGDTATLIVPVEQRFDKAEETVAEAA